MTSKPHLVLDFDGVIVNSVTLKHDCYSQVLSQICSDTGSLRSALDATKGLPRAAKLKQCLELLGIPTVDHKQLLENLSAEFRFLWPKIVESADFQEASRWVELLPDMRQHFNMVTCFSASPHDELEPLCHRLGLATCIDVLSGAGLVVTKEDRLRRFSEKNWIGSRVYSVGDSYADGELAQALGFEFVDYTAFH